MTLTQKKIEYRKNQVKSVYGENRLKHILGQKELFFCAQPFFALQLQNLAFQAWSVTESLQLDDEDKNERSRPQRIFQNRLSQQNKNVSIVLILCFNEKLA